MKTMEIKKGNSQDSRLKKKMFYGEWVHHLPIHLFLLFCLEFMK